MCQKGIGYAKPAANSQHIAIMRQEVKRQINKKTKVQCSTLKQVQDKSLK